MKINPFAVMREEVNGTGFVFVPDTNKVMSLNATGVVLWKALAGGANEREAVAVLLDKFRNVTAGQAEADVRAFMEQLAKKSLLTRERKN